jgi:hypothetical protein
MRKILTCLTIITAMTLPAHAALPPHFQRQAEFTAVLEVATDVLGIAHPIDAITLEETDIYSVRSGSCSLTVRIVDIKTKGNTGVVGPRQFEAVADPLAC